MKLSCKIRSFKVKIKIQQKCTCVIFLLVRLVSQLIEKIDIINGKNYMRHYDGLAFLNRICHHSQMPRLSSIRLRQSWGSVVEVGGNCTCIVPRNFHQPRSFFFYFYLFTYLFFLDHGLTHFHNNEKPQCDYSQLILWGTDYYFFYANLLFTQYQVT